MSHSIAIMGEPGHEIDARSLGETHDIPYVNGETAGYDAVLVVGAEHLELRWLDASAGYKPIATDLMTIDATSGHGRSLQQPLAKAVGLRKGDPYRPHVFDATAGYGQDAWLLASLGCRVTAVERSPVLALMLEDALRRAGETQPDIAAHITTAFGDSVHILEASDVNPRRAPHLHAGLRGGGFDVIYLDPMFPPKRKAAKPRKQMVLLSHIVGPDADSDALFVAAMKTAKRRVVVKRPLHAEPLAPDPVAVHAGKSHRFDVYLPRQVSAPLSR